MRIVDFKQLDDSVLYIIHYNVLYCKYTKQIKQRFKLPDDCVTQMKLCNYNFVLFAPRTSLVEHFSKEDLILNSLYANCKLHRIAGVCLIHIIIKLSPTQEVAITAL